MEKEKINDLERNSTKNKRLPEQNPPESKTAGTFPLRKRSRGGSSGAERRWKVGKKNRLRRVDPGSMVAKKKDQETKQERNGPGRPLVGSDSILLVIQEVQRIENRASKGMAIAIELKNNYGIKKIEGEKSLELETGDQDKC